MRRARQYKEAEAVLLHALSMGSGEAAWLLQKYDEGAALGHELCIVHKERWNAPNPGERLQRDTTDPRALALYRLYRGEPDKGCEILEPYLKTDSWAQAVVGRFRNDLTMKKLGAENGNAIAQHDLGLHYMCSGNLDAAEYWFSQAWEQGYGLAMIQLLGMFFKRGKWRKYAELLWSQGSPHFLERQVAWREENMRLSLEFGRCVVLFPEKCSKFGFFVDSILADCRIQYVTASQRARTAALCWIHAGFLVPDVRRLIGQLVYATRCDPDWLSEH